MNTEQIKNLITELIQKVHLEVTDITVVEDPGSSIWFSVQVTEPHFFIKNDAEALHALNHIVRRIVESGEQAVSLPEAQRSKKDKSIVVDINDFQKKRVENIRAVAHLMSERARYFKSNIEIDPMSAFERRIVHEFLSEAADVRTESVGFGPSRRVVIKYIGDL